MRRMIGFGGAVAVVATGILMAGTASATKPGTYEGPFVEDGHKVTICHRTGSASNPYVVITVDIAAVDGSGGNDHSHHDKVGNGPVGDVIPPIDGVNSGEGVGNGKNWQGSTADANDGNWPAGTPRKDIDEAACVSAPA